VVVEEFSIAQPKTKLFIEKMNELSLESALVISDSVEENLYLAARNVPKVDVVDTAALDPVSLVSFEKVVVTVAALKKIEEALA